MSFDFFFCCIMVQTSSFIFPHVSSPRHMNITSIFETSYGVAQELGHPFTITTKNAKLTKSFWVMLEFVLLSRWEVYCCSIGESLFCCCLGFYYYHFVNTSAGGLVVIPDGIIRPVVSVSALSWLLRYMHYWNLNFLNKVIIIKTIYRP